MSYRELPACFDSCEVKFDPHFSTGTLRGACRIDDSEGLGLILKRLGLIVHGVKLESRFEDFDAWGSEGIVTHFQRHSGVFLDLAAQLHPEAVLSLKTRETPDGLYAPVALHLDYEDSTREAAEEMVPVIIEQWRSQNGEFTHRAAALLGMLLVEMLWAAAS